MEFETGQFALARLKAGVDKLADPVRATLGPTGRNVIFWDEVNNRPIITNDGVTIARYIELTDPVEKFGAAIVKQVALETNNLAGDGTTTSVVLAQALLDACIDHIEKHEGTDPLEVRNALNTAVVKAELELTKKATKLTKARFKDVATVSVGGNAELGKLVAETMIAVDGGEVTVENMVKLGTEVEITEGILQYGGVAAPHLAPEKVTFEQAPILVIDCALNTAANIMGILQGAVQAGHKQMVIAAESFSEEILGLLITNHQRGVIHVLPIRVTEFADIAAATGATVISKLGTSNLRNIDATKLGTARKVVADVHQSLILGEGKGQDKVAIIKIGVPTEVEFQETQMRLEDAICAVKAAKEQGVLQGGGIPLSEVADIIETMGKGHWLLAKAMRAPLIQIRENGFKGQVAPGVVDPLKVVTTALKNAVSAVGTLITTDTVIYKEDIYFD